MYLSLNLIQIPTKLSLNLIQYLLKTTLILLHFSMLDRNYWLPISPSATTSIFGYVKKPIPVQRWTTFFLTMERLYQSKSNRGVLENCVRCISLWMWRPTIWQYVYGKVPIRSKKQRPSPELNSPCSTFRSTWSTALNANWTKFQTNDNQ